LARGASAYLHEKGFRHAKTACIDGKLAYIRTVNLDIRSFYINFEVSSIIHDDLLCGAMSSQSAPDKLDSTHLTMDKWLKRPKLKRGMDSVCRLLAPLL